MKHKFGIFISISAVSVFSFLAIARNTPAHKPVGSAQLEALTRNARLAEGPSLSEQDAQNADLAITSRIREEITERKDLSVNARNVKIITTGGRVVLKGVVITPEEKRLIGDVAISVQRGMDVDNQLTIGSSSSAPSAPTGLRMFQ